MIQKWIKIFREAYLRKADCKTLFAIHKEMRMELFDDEVEELYKKACKSYNKEEL